MITEKEVKLMALTDMIIHLKAARVSAKLGGFTGYEVDDAISELIEQAEFAYDEIGE